MLVVLEAAGMLVDRTASEWYLTSGGPRAQFSDHPAPRQPSRLGTALKQGVSRLAGWVQRFRERRQVVQSLTAMDDRLLADIGITREQIPEVAAAALDRGPLHPSRLLTPKSLVRSEAVAVDQVANDNEKRIAA